MTLPQVDGWVHAIEEVLSSQGFPDPEVTQREALHFITQGGEEAREGFLRWISGSWSPISSPI